MGELHETRRGRLTALLAANDVDALLVTRLVNVRYLTGLASSNAALLVRAEGPAVLATDARYAGTAAAVCPDLELLVERQTAQVLTTLAADSGARRLGFEAHDVTVEKHAELAALDRGVEPTGGVWTEERGTSDEGRRRQEASARRRAERDSALEPTGGVWTEERGTSDEGRRRQEASARRRAERT
ncbi:aminopeptidase P family N-terminal domain-containing protein, partial [Spirillospora sp. NPDC048911]|uniref:aminopeptidase P family N-terminal domain-containing protein n=1 Tax=Spirillospora sp. NPDC048911 TaxID=3364527 RepID=UPI00371E65DE